MNPTDHNEQPGQAKLTPQQYEVTRNKATEPPFTGKYVDHKQDGVYRCVCCGQALFDSRAKFDSGSGWPSYTEPIDPSAVAARTDESHGMIRTEILCKACDAHLGHVFDDGPAPTGRRYCVNSAALDFAPRKTDPT